MEVQVEDRLLAGRQARGDHLLVEGGEEAALVVVGQPVGVAGERGLLRQHRQAGEQGAGRVGEQVVDVADAPGGGELEGQQGQQPGDGGDHFRARVSGLAGQGGQVEGDQVGDGQQQPGEPGAGGGGGGGGSGDPCGGDGCGPARRGPGGGGRLLPGRGGRPGTAAGSRAAGGRTPPRQNAGPVSLPHATSTTSTIADPGTGP